MGAQPKLDLSSIPNQVVKIITNPAGFYRAMPKDGGFVEPLIFMVVLGVVAGLLKAILSIFGLGAIGMFAVGLVSIIVVPIVVVIFGFVGAAIIYVIWMIMGSKESYETAFRCIAYTAVIMPISAVLGIIPYLGAIISTAWVFYLLIIASVEVQNIKANLAYIVFGIIGLVLIIINVSGEYTSRQMVSSMEQFGKNVEDMTPEEAGQALGEFLKGLEKTKEK